jgi:hypothetical protein
MRKTGIGVAALIVLGPFALGALLGADEPKAAAARNGDLAGKVLVITMKGQPDQGVVLDKVQVKQLGDQWFVVGKVLEDAPGRPWSKGRTMWVPLTNVASMVEFDDAGQLRRAGPERPPREER